jgi:hypothetical protein
VARSPYRIARQEHVGDMLDELQDLGLLDWHWDYENSSAVYWVTESGQSKRKLGTKQAEELVLKLCKQQAIVWLPVPPPGGEDQRANTLRKMAELRGIPATEASVPAQFGPIAAVSFDLAAYPGLSERLHDELTSNRSAQTYRVARQCVELGLSDGQIKWFIAQYKPFLDKYRRRTDADRELDRVIGRAREDAAT